MSDDSVRVAGLAADAIRLGRGAGAVAAGRGAARPLPLRLPAAAVRDAGPHEHRAPNAGLADLERRRAGVPRHLRAAVRAAGAGTAARGLGGIARDLERGVAGGVTRRRDAARELADLDRPARVAGGA